MVKIEFTDLEIDILLTMLTAGQKKWPDSLILRLLKGKIQDAKIHKTIKFTEESLDTHV